METKRKTQYRVNREKLIAEVQQYCRMGRTEQEAAERFKLSKRTVAYYKQIGLKEEPKGLCRGMSEVEFIESAEGLGFPMFPMQRLIIKAFYGLPFDEAERGMMDRLVAEGKTTWKPGQKYSELVLKCGMKGGKTELISAMSCVEEWKLYLLGDPQAHYGLPKGKEIYIINVATDKEQAKDTVFASTEARIKNSKFYSQRDFKSGQYTFEFPHTHTKMLSGHSNSASIVGRTAKLVLFDELARFTEKKTGRSSGKTVYTSLTRSTAPFRDDARIASLSSVIHEEDMICELFDLSKEIPSMLGFWLATWEINPNLPFDCQYLQNELKKSPEDFWRDFGCQPAKAIEKYIRDRLKIKKMFVAGRKAGLVNPFSDEGTLKDSFHGEEDVNYFMHLDPAVNNCSFGMAIAGKKGGIISVPLAYGVVAKGNSEIDFEELKVLIGLILDRFPNMNKVSFDSYIAASLAQYITKRGVNVEFMSVQKSQYDAFKIEGLYREIIRTYPNRVLDRELKGLDLLNGKKIEKPAKGSKDISDAVAGAVSHAINDIQSEGGDVTLIEVGEDSSSREDVPEGGRRGLIF